MLSALRNGSIDVGLAAVTATAQREAVVDFSLAFFHTGLAVMTRTSSSVSDQVAHLSATMGGVVLLFAMLVGMLSLAGGVVIFVLEEALPGPRPVFRGGLRGLQDSIVLTASLLFGARVRLPSGALSQPVAGVCTAANTLVTVLLTASATVAIAAASNPTEIAGVDDLPGRTVVCPRGSSAQQYLLQNIVGVRIEYTDGVEAAFDAFRDGTGDAFLYDRPVLLNWMRREEARTGRRDYSVVGGSVQAQQYALAMSPRLRATGLEDALSRAILEFYGTDSQLSLDERYFGESGGDGSSQAEGQTDVAALRSQLASLAILAGAAVGIALVLAGAVFLWLRSPCGQDEEEDAVIRHRLSRRQRADARSFKQRQWDAREEARGAPVLPPEDLAWETFERVQALFEQALLQRAKDRLYVPAGAEELSPEQDEDVDGIADS
jgi:ABC-type amino acid transport substrate-binding protein